MAYPKGKTRSAEEVEAIRAGAYRRHANEREAAFAEKARGILRGLRESKTWAESIGEVSHDFARRIVRLIGQTGTASEPFLDVLVVAADRAAATAKDETVRSLYRQIATAAESGHRYVVKVYPAIVQCDERGRFEAHIELSADAALEAELTADPSIRNVLDLFE